MFDKILIKSGSNVLERHLSIPDLVDMMFYYNEVHVVISQFELKQLLSVFGEDILFQLIKTRRLIIHPCDQHIGASMYDGMVSLGLYRHDYRSIDELLYNFHKEFIDDSKQNKRFADRFSPVLEQYQYPSYLQNSLYEDIESESLLTTSTKFFINHYYPTYEGIDSIKIKAEPEDTPIMKMFRIGGNLRLDELNSIHQKMGYRGDFSYSAILIALGETNIDCYLTSELGAELIANQQLCELYKHRMNSCMINSENSLNNINHFHEMVSKEFLSPGQSFKERLISASELLEDLNSKTSVYFRDWLSGLPSDSSLIHEAFKEMQNVNSGKPWVKLSRLFVLFLAGLLQPLIGTGLSFLDTFVGDKIINGWTPALFATKVLSKDIYKR